MGKFRAWVPNATGNLSFSLIGQVGQPSPCEDANFVSRGRRLVVVKQRRNLSDNLLFKYLQTPWTGAHELDFTIAARTGNKSGDTYGVLHGWIFIHEHCPAELRFLDKDSLCVRTLNSSLVSSADFGVAFRLDRTGRMTLKIPGRFQDQLVEYGDREVLTGGEALRPLAAQCFYFLRDITHLHQHHSADSDTLTTVWPTDDESRWIRETLYELYRRVLMLRRQQSPRGQEDALGILAYIASFEETVATPAREAVAQGTMRGFVPSYGKAGLKDSLNANLETKRRKRVQKNVVAAAIPVFTAAMFSLANAIYKDPDFVAPGTLVGWIGALSARPLTSAIGLLGAYEWLFPFLAILGFTWIAAFAGVMQPSEGKAVKATAQASASWGPRFGPLTLFAIAGALAAVIWLLLTYA
jgi:hypothetical protein